MFNTQKDREDYVLAVALQIESDPTAATKFKRNTMLMISTRMEVLSESFPETQHLGTLGVKEDLITNVQMLRSICIGRDLVTFAALEDTFQEIRRNFEVLTASGFLLCWPEFWGKASDTRREIDALLRVLVEVASIVGSL